MLSILGTHSIALPLSPAFPAHELKYIMDHSQSSMLLSSKKFEKKASEVVKQGLERSPKHVILEKKMGNTTPGRVTLEGRPEREGGIMLYTSGTTNRPASFTSLYSYSWPTNKRSERRSPSAICYDCTSSVSHQSLEIHTVGSSASRTSSPSHPRHHKRRTRAPFCRLYDRISLSFQCPISLASLRSSLSPKLI